MIHEHEALELASGAIDFGLSPELERELAETYRDCPICAERAASYHEQIRLMRRLPVLDASAHTRQRVTAAALSGRGDTRSPLVLALAAALLVGLLLAAAAAAGALLNRQPRLLVDVTSPAAPSGSIVVAEASSEPVASSDLSGGGFADDLPADSIVEVVSSNLRVRSEPRVADDSIMYEPLLQVGDRLFVVEGPVRASDYDWYRVEPVNTDPTRPFDRLPSGWVSRGDHDESPWIAPAADKCPSEPLEIVTLNTMHPLERLACFRRSRLKVLAVIKRGDQSGWIADARNSGNIDAPVENLDVVVEPGPGLERSSSLPDGRAALLEGTFDDRACGGVADERERLDCRSRFIVTRATVDPTQLANRGLAITLTDHLRLRDIPLITDPSEQRYIDSGTRLAVLEGPAVGSGYVWYRVAVPSIASVDGAPATGWVAVHGTDGEEWVRAEDFDCPPPSSLTFATLAELMTPPIYHGGLACYGTGATYARTALTVQGRARVDCSGPPVTGSPWLMDFQRSLVLRADGRDIRAAMSAYPGELPCNAPATAVTYRATGHFDDDDTALCRSAGVGPSELDPVASYRCGNRFVVTALSVVAPVPAAVPTPSPTPPAVEGP
ncbi:MAG: hypothetical protein ACJ765_03895 [Chloroflexota bacterium]